MYEIPVQKRNIFLMLFSIGWVSLPNTQLGHIMGINEVSSVGLFVIPFYIMAYMVPLIYSDLILAPIDYIFDLKSDYIDPDVKIVGMYLLSLAVFVYWCRFFLNPLTFYIIFFAAAFRLVKRFIDSHTKY